MCREVTLPSSSSWMYIAYNLLLIWFYPYLISLFMTKRRRKILFYFDPFVDDWQKGGERFWFIGERFWIYMHVLWKRIVYAYMFCFANVWRWTWWVLWFFWHVVFAYMSYICIHVYELYCISIHLFVMHELRGSFFEALL